MKDLSQEGQRKRSLMSEPKVAVPEPVSPEGPSQPLPASIQRHLDRLPSRYAAPEAAAAGDCYTRMCDCTHALISHAVSGRCIAQGCACMRFMEVAAPVPKSYNDFLRKYYPATAEKLIAGSADREQPAAELKPRGPVYVRAKGGTHE